MLECALIDEAAVLGFHCCKLDWLKIIVETHWLLVQILDLLVVIEAR